MSTGVGETDFMIAVAGGAGINCANRLMERKLNRSWFMAVDTDVSALARCAAFRKITVNSGETGADFEQRVSPLLGHRRRLFVIAGLGGEAGSRFALWLAEYGSRRQMSVECFVFLPFLFEGARNQRADETLEKLEPVVYRLHVFKNDDLRNRNLNAMTMTQVFDVLHDAVFCRLAPCLEQGG